MDHQRYQELYDYLSNGTYPENFTKENKYVLGRKSKSFKIDGERLVYLDEQSTGEILERVVLRGREDVERVILECHLTAGGHRGRDATVNKVKERYYWPSYYKDIQEKIKLCDRCQRNGRELKTAATVLRPIKVTPEVWYMVGMDLIGPFRETPEGWKYVLTMTDYFSKYVEAIPIVDKSAPSVSKAIYRVYLRHGAPSQIICDQGREFINQLNEGLQATFNVKLRVTSAYHPQSNGLDERTNQTLKRCISKMMENEEDDWGQYLEAAVFATNTSKQKTTQVTPFRMMFGREPRFPLQAEIEAEDGHRVKEVCSAIADADPIEVLKMISEKQQEIFGLVDARIKAAQEKQITQYAKKKGTVEYSFKIGDKVLRRNMLQKTKKGHKREDTYLGPYTIVELSSTSCLVKNKAGKLLKQRIHLSQLKPYFSPGEETKSETTPPSKSETTPTSKSETTPTSKSETTPPSKSETTPTSKSETTPPSKSETTPPSKSETTPPSKSETTPTSKSETTPPPKSETTPTSKSETNTPPSKSLETLLFDGSLLKLWRTGGYEELNAFSF